MLTKQQQIAEWARKKPQRSFVSLAHHIDKDWMLQAWRRVRKDGAVGVDNETAEEFAENLDERLEDLLNRAKSGRYQAPPVRRSYVPKGTGPEQRPIGIPTVEDKVLQRAVVMVLEPIYEQGLFGLLVWVSARSLAAWGTGSSVEGDPIDGGVLDSGRGCTKVLRSNRPRTVTGVSGSAGARWSDSTTDRQVVESRSVGIGPEMGTGRRQHRKGE